MTGQLKGNISVTVILPAYNCAAYIEQAVYSVLNQTFTDFELLVIDDGSTDDTAGVVSRITDSRLKLIRNDGNKGLVYSLNRGIEMATGIYIARMDGDDISVPDRFQKQIDYLETHPATGLVTSTAELIDEEDGPAGVWADDRKFLSAREIRRFLPVNNCIVHPAVMIRTEILKRYLFRPEQSQAEDYDLWLRLAAGNVILEKLDEPLLRHRILTQSFTRKRQKNVFFKNARTKLKFTQDAMARGQINSFVIKTFFYSVADLAMGCAKRLKSIFKF